MSTDLSDMSKKRFVVFIYELRQEIVFAEEFTGRYSKSVTLSDGTTRTVELTPMVRDGRPVLEFNDTGGRTYIGTVRAGTGTAVNGKLILHRRGGVLVPTPSLEEARRIAAEITAEAAQQGHGLLCRPVSIHP